MSFARLIALAIRNPLVTAASFVAVVVLFTALIVVSYPDGDAQTLPVVEARGGDYKVSPDFESGMEIAHEDSTVFGAVRGIEPAAGIENLLGDVEEASASMSMSKDDILAAQDESSEMNEKDLELLALLSEELKEPATPEATPDKSIGFMPAKTETQDAPKVAQKTLEKTAVKSEKIAAMVAPKTKPVVQAKVEAPQDDTAQRLAALKSNVTSAATKPAANNAAPSSATSGASKSIQISRVDPVAGRSALPTPTVAPANSAKATQQGTAGQSNDTLQFVRSVLDQKDTKQAGNLNAIATAAGTAGDTGAASVARDRFVQLGSVRSAEGGESEWTKLQKQFSSELDGAPHRITSVDLGEKGTFFRIQAGPFTAAQADAICTSIKAQKPGGCLIVK